MKDLVKATPVMYSWGDIGVCLYDFVHCCKMNLGFKCRILKCLCIMSTRPETGINPNVDQLAEFL